MNTPSEIAERVQREKISHTEYDVLEENLKIKSKFRHVTEYPSIKKFYQEIDSYLADLTGKVVLDYGCGRGTASFKYLQNNALQVYGIDISEVYINDCIQKARHNGIPLEKYSFSVMDAHHLEFPDNTFDIIIGYGILHHLDAATAMREIYRVLKPQGRIILQEPLADNILLKIFRAITPKARTLDEKPFSRTDILSLYSMHDWKIETKFCGLWSLPASMVTSFLLPNNPDNFILRFTEKLDNWCIRNNILVYWNQYISINLIKQ